MKTTTEAICNGLILFCVVTSVVGVLGTLIGVTIIVCKAKPESDVQVPGITVASMDFTVFNISQTRLSAEWDLSIRIPKDLPGFYICLQGNLQASFQYKNVTLATSSPQKYNDLYYYQPQILKVSAVVSEEDITGKDIMEDIKEKKEMKFGPGFSLTDCRPDSTGTMNYACDEVTLRFEPGSNMKATLFGKHATCTGL